jgi:hypothetical protein
MSLIRVARRAGHLYPSIREKHLPVAQERIHMAERPSSPSILVALVALLGVTAGCLGAGLGGPTTATPTPSPTSTPNTDCPPSLTVTELPTDQVDAESAVAYANLTAERRATFDRAHDGSVEDFAYAWHDIDLVEYEGRYYRTGILVC